jgi:hypothetical protein
METLEVAALIKGVGKIELPRSEGLPYATCATPESRLMLLHQIPDAVAA